MDEERMPKYTVELEIPSRSWIPVASLSALSDGRTVLTSKWEAVKQLGKLRKQHPASSYRLIEWTPEIVSERPRNVMLDELHEKISDLEDDDLQSLLHHVEDFMGWLRKREARQQQKS